MNFYQRTPPFLIQLQSILRKYPDGGQILKELLQNADDAKASQVIFIYDEREYGTDTLYSEDLHSIQGPALVVYNNEVFSESDWKGIQTPGNSIKRKDPNTVGRFGLGFNSVYHITDYPAIFSGNYVGILDPQESIHHGKGILWNLENNMESIKELTDQFLPFRRVLEDTGLGSWNEILNAGCFQGTLFRFPLRVKPSEISENTYSSEKVQELFESFITDAGISLLFLRHVNTVSLQRIGSDGVVIHLLTVSVSTQTIASTKSDNITTESHLKITSLKDFDGVKECTWLVQTSTAHGSLFTDLIELSEKLSNKPSLDLAYPLNTQDTDVYAGRLSCVLPLPDKEENQTGLPVVINGCFDLTDDRRSMKWLEIDQQHDNAAKWNHILVHNLLPLVYICAVKDAVALVKMSKITTDMAYGIWPNPEKTKFKDKWYSITKQIAQLLLCESFLQTADNSDWITASRAIFVFNIEDNDLQNCIEEVLLFLKQPLVRIPEHIQKTLELAENNTGMLNSVTPSFIRMILKSGNWNTIPNEHKMLLLRYVLSDGQYDDLLNLQLLPLADGTFTSFQNSDSADTVYIDSQDFPRILLPGILHRFLPPNLPKDILSHLSNIGSKRIFRNLLELNEDIIIHSLSEALPKSWLRCHDQVLWNPEDPNHPPSDWLSTFWKFLQRYENNLSFFENHPLLPLNLIEEGCTDIHLARLKIKTTLLFQKREGNNLTENMTNILEQLGCTVIREANTWLWHKNLSSYILVPTPNNILKVFSNLDLNKLLQTFTCMSEESIKEFIECLSQAYTFTAPELDILCQLPIFYPMTSLECSDSRLVPACDLCAVEKNTFPAVPENLLYPKTLIKCRDEADCRLLQQMNIHFLNAPTVALLLGKTIELGWYKNNQQDAQNAILWILRNGDALFIQNSELPSLLENLAFVPCNGALVTPSDLFDPSVKLFNDLFGPHQFPPADYQEETILRTLRTLGLKHQIHKISVSDVIQIAVEVSQKQDHLSVKKSKALIQVCNDTAVLYTINMYENQLRSLAWVPIDSDTRFIEPEKIRNLKYSDIVEFSMPLSGEFNEVASLILGLNDLPPSEKVVENLTTLTQKYQSQDPHSLLIKLHNIYHYVQINIKQFCDSLLSNLSIWNGDGFSYPTEIVLVYPDGLDLSSMVKKVTPDFLIYKNLFIKCGVRQTLTETEVINILYVLESNIESRESLSGTHEEKQLAISILDWMKTNSVHGKEDLPIPVQKYKNTFCLKPLSTTLFCDMDKKHLKDISSSGSDFNIVHEDLSQATAKYLDIPLLSTKILKPEFFEPWGPSEPITVRIKNILREYSESVDIFKELIQNADDAEATVCEFLVDMRQNATSQQSLIDPDMAKCHGPALWSYNNRSFTDNDFHNITRVGAATKETEIKKIGKFGLGFNTVYLITDIPLIMSGSHVVIFDPNVNHIRKHIPNDCNPGIKLNLKMKPEILHIFPDQFQPFSTVFGCELKQPFHYDGTLIRLPFRTEKEANMSQICKQACSEEQIEILIMRFEETTDTLLVFLRNVQVLTIQFLGKDLCPGDQLLRASVQKDNVLRLDVPPDILLQQQINTSQLLGIQMNDLDIAVSNIIKITVQPITKTNEKYYLLQSSLGIEASIHMFSQKKSFICPLPFAGVALPLKKHNNTVKWAPDLKNFNGMVFCFLPLPISTGLPFHLNGCFAVMSNRKGLWDTTEKGEWNQRLLTDAALVALITALSQLQILNQQGDLQDYCYYTFWPDVTKVNTQYKELSKSFYQALTFGISDSFPALFSNGQESCTIKYACFLKLGPTLDQSIYSLAQKIFSLFLKKPYLAVPLPEWVVKGFIVSNCVSELKHCIYNCERFYAEIVFENLNFLDTEDRNMLIIYAIKKQEKYLDNLLVSKPCIPTSCSGKLQFIGKLVQPKSKVAVLYDQEEGCFPQGSDFLHPHVLSRLEDLGMIKDRLSMQEIIQRACKIQIVWKNDRTKALKQICCVLELLNDLHEHLSDSQYQETFRNILFLPAIPPDRKPDGITDLQLYKSEDLFHYKHKELVHLSKPVLSEEHVGKMAGKIVTFLGLDRFPPYHLVLLQLLEANKNSGLLSNHQLSCVAKKCYYYLNQLLQRDPSKSVAIRKQTLDKAIIYTTKVFVSVGFVAHKMPFDASPYLYQLPLEYQEFNILWDCLGIREEFSIQTYFKLLEMMALMYNGSPLPAKELQVALRLILNSAEKIPDDLSCISTDMKIFVPDIHCVLREANHLYFNDTPWLASDDNLDDVFHFCHDMIPRPVALKLGIETKIHHMLNTLKISNLSPWGSQFGAKEELTTRLKNILREYSTQKDILKELIQNADDAEATEIHFVLDSRTHQATSTFGSEWNPLHGPALCIYNNQTFDPKDVEGIQLLGTGGKRGLADKTGRFGTGFNSVYHITDCPSFLTGDKIMCVFDPNLNFLPSSTVDSPGGMFSVNDRFKDTFKDVYNTFLPSVFNLQAGTFFRLPLRMANTVAMSKISNQTVSLENIRNMCRELEEDADSMILFLNNIKTITFSEISDARGVREIMHIKSEFRNLGKSEQIPFQEMLSKVVENDISEILPVRATYLTEIKCSSYNNPHKWLLVKQIGTEGEDNMANVQKMSRLLHEKMIPLGCVAVGLNVNTEGRAFCTLPLPVNTGLSAHISGNFMVDSSRRDICSEDGRSPKTNWNIFILTKVIGPLYSYLLNLIKDMFGNTEPLQFKNWLSYTDFLERYLSFFPYITASVPPLWQKLVRQVYQTISQEQFKLIPIYKKQDKVIFVEWSSLGQSSISEAPCFHLCNGDTDVTLLLQSMNMKLAVGKSLHAIYKEFKESDINVMELSPKTLCNFLRHVPIHPQGNSLPTPVCETILREIKNCKLLVHYCLEVYTRKAQGLDLIGIPLLVTEDGMLRYFNREKPCFYTKFYKLFPDHSNRFAKDYGLETKLLIDIGLLQNLTYEGTYHFITEFLGPAFKTSGKININQTKSHICKEWLKMLWSFFENELQLYQEKQIFKKNFEKIQNLFQDWAILPVTYKMHPNEITLLPLRGVNTILANCTGEVEKCLFNLGFPVVDSTIVSHQMIIIHMDFYLLKTKSCISVVQKLSSERDLNWTILKEGEMDTLLSYFIEGLRTNNKIIYQLQDLPLFETHSGDRRCLSAYKHKHILDVSHLVARTFFELDCQTVFLKRTKANTELSQYLNITFLDEHDFLLKFILRRFQLLSQNEVLQILGYVLDVPDDSKYNEITKALKPLPFIRDRQGELQNAAFFYDSRINLFSTFRLQSRFIPDELIEKFESRQRQLFRLLKDLGMHSEPTEEDFICFATIIQEEEAAGISLELLSPKIKELLENILSLDETKITRKFANELGSIAFLIPLKVCNDLKSLHPPYAKQNVLVPLNGSLLKQKKDDELVAWTSMSLLGVKNYLNHKDIQLLKRFGLLCKPPLCNIVINLKNVCNSRCDSKKLLQIRREILIATYHALQEEQQFNVGSLTEVPFILVNGDALAQPNMVVFNLPYDERFEPYLFKLPKNLLRYTEFFQKAGVEAEATVFHYANVLSTVYEETLNKTSLHSNLKRTVAEATRQLFKILEEEKPNNIHKLKQLHLPGTDGKLYDSSTLVLLNCHFMATEKLSDTFKFCNLDCVKPNMDLYQQESLIKLLPDKIRPKLLSQITEQCIDVNSIAFCTYEENCELWSDFDRILNSPEFQEGLVDLLRSQYNGKITEECAAQKCKAVLEKLEIKCCLNLQTILKHDGDIIKGTNVSKEISVTVGTNGQCQIYFVHKDNIYQTNIVKIISTFAEEMNNIMQNVFSQKSLSILMQMLSCKHPDEIKKILKEKGIWMKRIMRHHQLSLSDPGEPIPSEWYEFLNMNILNSFRVGDFVGYMCPSDEDLYLYAVIVEELDAKTYANCEINMYRIQRGQDIFDDVSILDLYQFKRNIIQKNNALVLVEDTTQADEKDEKWYDLPTEDIKKEINMHLSKLWELPETERKKAIRRLYLKYHPDKNRRQEKLATEMCKYIQKRIEELEAGKSLSNLSQATPSSQYSSRRSNSFRNRTQGSHSRQSRSSTSSESFSDYWAKWDEQAFNHKKEGSSEKTWQKSKGDRSKTTSSNPQEAERWFRQAECDLKAAEHDAGHQHTEWVFFKIHQAVEKALFSAQYMKCGNVDTNVNIHPLANNVSTFDGCLNGINEQVLQMQRHGVDKLKTQYPNYHSPPGIPNDCIPQDKEQEVIGLAKDVLKKIKSYVYQ
ncbi:sacsin-like isoform X2 [Xenopus laevis]|uniref:Sacsin-like isoform X2 n=1 Tax=Xenopus laevis TaxID=8355 RepID=A0A8J1L7C8_XENLA|nr:sacsin-like isoform X2 [Xenopus laevis]